MQQISALEFSNISNINNNEKSSINEDEARENQICNTKYLVLCVNEPFFFILVWVNILVCDRNRFPMRVFVINLVINTAGDNNEYDKAYQYESCAARIVFKNIIAHN